MSDTLHQWINPLYLEKQKQLRRRFAHNKPFPHLALVNFFNPAKIRRVAGALHALPFARKETDLFQFGQTNDFKAIKNKSLHDFYTFFTSREFINHIARLTNTKLSKPVDMSGFIYSPADYLLPHDDRLEGRKVAYILNLSQDFTKKDGGELELFATKNRHPMHIMKEVPPKFNTFTIFRVTPRSFHQVHEVLGNKKRLSIGGWFHGS